MACSYNGMLVQLVLIAIANVGAVIFTAIAAAVDIAFKCERMSNRNISTYTHTHTRIMHLLNHYANEQSHFFFTFIGTFLEFDGMTEIDMCYARNH